MHEIKCAKRLAYVFVHFVTARASLFTDHNMSGLPIRARYRHLRTICEQTLDNSLIYKWTFTIWNFFPIVFSEGTFSNCLSHNSPVILVQWILRTHQNHLLQCHLGIQPCLETFDTEVPTTNSQDDKYPSMTRNELFCPYSLLHRSLLFSFLTSVSCHAGFSSVFPILSPLLPLHLEFVIACGIGMNLWTRL